MLKIIVQSLLVATIIFYSSVNAQKIIFLNGTTSAGKSSIACELKELLEQKDFKVEIFAIDTYVVKKVTSRMRSGYYNPLNWRSSTSDMITSEKMKCFINESQKELCTATTKAYGQGKIVIVDTVMIEQDHIQSYTESFKKLNVAWVLVYCPLATLIERIIDRNETSDINNQRSMVQTLNQFSLMYSQNASQPLDTLDRETFHDTCSKAQKAHTKTQLKTPDYIKDIQNASCPFSFETIQESMKTKFGLDNNSEATIGPVSKYHCIINTERTSASTNARMILEELKL